MVKTSEILKKSKVVIDSMEILIMQKSGSWSLILNYVM